MGLIETAGLKSNSGAGGMENGSGRHTPGLRKDLDGEEAPQPWGQLEGAGAEAEPRFEGHRRRHATAQGR